MERFAFKIDDALKQNLYKICRLCGMDNPEKLPIISEDPNADEEELPKKIQECIGFIISIDDKMPQSACTQCVEKINDFYEFREMCYATDIQTRKLLGIKREKKEKSTPVMTEVKEKKERPGPTLKDVKDKKEKPAPAPVPKDVKVKKEKLVPVGKELRDKKVKSAFLLKKLKEKKEKRIPLGKDSKELPKRLLRHAVAVKKETPLALAKQTRKRKYEDMRDGQPEEPPVKKEIPIESKSITNKKMRLDTPVAALGCETPKISLAVLPRGRMKINKKQEVEAEVKDEPVEVPPELKQLCNICDQRFKTKAKLNQHLEIAHVPNIPRFICTACNEIIKKNSDIRNHQLWHKLSKTPYICNLCKESVVTTYAFARHLRDHNYDAPASVLVLDRECPSCRSTFITNFLYNTHACAVRTKKCAGCNRMLRNEQEYIRHAAICGKAYLNFSTHIPPSKSLMESCVRIKNENDVEAAAGFTPDLAPNIQTEADTPEPKERRGRKKAGHLKGSKKNSKKGVSKKDLRRVDELIKSTIDALVSIKHEEEVHVETDGEPDDIPNEQDHFADDCPDSDGDMATAADAPSEINVGAGEVNPTETETSAENPAQNVAIKQERTEEGNEDYSMTHVSVRVKQEITNPECNEESPSSKVPALKIKITKEHGTLNSSLIDTVSVNEKKKKKKKRKASERNHKNMLDGTPTPQQVCAQEVPLIRMPQPGTIRIKQEKVDDDYQEVSTHIAATVMTSIPLMQMQIASVASGVDFNETAERVLEQPTEPSETEQMYQSNEEVQDIKPNRLDLDRMIQIMHVTSGVEMPPEEEEYSCNPKRADDEADKVKELVQTKTRKSERTGFKSTASWLRSTRKTCNGVVQKVYNKRKRQSDVPQTEEEEHHVEKVLIKAEPVGRGYSDEAPADADFEEEASSRVRSPEHNFDNSIESRAEDEIPTVSHLGSEAGHTTEEQAYMSSIDFSSVAIKQENEFEVPDEHYEAANTAVAYTEENHDDSQHGGSMEIRHIKQEKPDEELGGDWETNQNQIVRSPAHNLICQDADSDSTENTIAKVVAGESAVNLENQFSAFVITNVCSGVEEFSGHGAFQSNEVDETAPSLEPSNTVVKYSTVEVTVTPMETTSTFHNATETPVSSIVAPVKSTTLESTDILYNLVETADVFIGDSTAPKKALDNSVDETSNVMEAIAEPMQITTESTVVTSIQAEAEPVKSIADLPETTANAMELRVVEMESNIMVAAAASVEAVSDSMDTTVDSAKTPAEPIDNIVNLPDTTADAMGPRTVEMESNIMGATAVSMETASDLMGTTVDSAETPAEPIDNIVNLRKTTADAMELRFVEMESKIMVVKAASVESASDSMDSIADSAKTAAEPIDSIVNLPDTTADAMGPRVVKMESSITVAAAASMEDASDLMETTVDSAKNPVEPIYNIVNLRKTTADAMELRVEMESKIMVAKAGSMEAASDIMDITVDSAKNLAEPIDSLVNLSETTADAMELRVVEMEYNIMVAKDASMGDSSNLMDTTVDKAKTPAESTKTMADLKETTPAAMEISFDSASDIMEVAVPIDAAIDSIQLTADSMKTTADSIEAEDDLMEANIDAVQRSDKIIGAIIDDSIDAKADLIESVKTTAESMEITNNAMEATVNVTTYKMEATADPNTTVAAQMANTIVSNKTTAQNLEVVVNKIETTANSLGDTTNTREDQASSMKAKVNTFTLELDATNTQNETMPLAVNSTNEFEEAITTSAEVINDSLKTTSTSLIYRETSVSRAEASTTQIESTIETTAISAATPINVSPNPMEVPDNEYVLADIKALGNPLEITADPMEVTITRCPEENTTPVVEMETSLVQSAATLLGTPDSTISATSSFGLKIENVMSIAVSDPRDESSITSADTTETSQFEGVAFSSDDINVKASVEKRETVVGVTTGLPETSTIAQQFLNPDIMPTETEPISPDETIEMMQNIQNHEKVDEQILAASLDESMQAFAKDLHSTPNNPGELPLSCISIQTSVQINDEETENRINESADAEQRQLLPHLQFGASNLLLDAGSINEIAENNNNANIERELHDDAAPELSLPTQEDYEQEENSCNLQNNGSEGLS